MSSGLLARAKLIFLREQPDDCLSVGNPGLKDEQSSLTL